MNIRMMAWVTGSTFLLALGAVGAVACSSDSGTGTPTNNNNTGNDAATSHTDGGGGNGGGNDSGSGNGGNNDSGGGGGDDGGGAADCGKTPTLHPTDAGTGAYCPFSGTGDAGNLTCAFGQHCCEPGTGNATCAADCASLADSGTDWACQGNAQCGAGEVCCAEATSVNGPDPGCTYLFLSHFKGTVCAPGGCPAGTYQMCESTSECATGTCTAAKGKGAEFGMCH
jgi:hypothetical protein